MPDNKIHAAALTFDDGPDIEITPMILEKLKRYNVKATFFLIGNNITLESAKVAKAAYDMGCELANHSLTHTAFTDLSVKEMQDEIDITSQRVTEICGETPRFFRPPYIALNDTVYNTVKLPMICGVGAEDWLDSVSAEQRAERILNQVTDGSIILLHDQKGNIKTVQALDIIIPELLSRGYILPVLSDLFRIYGVTPQTKMLYSGVL